MQPITWKTVTVDIKKIKPTPRNYKLEIDGGSSRLDVSLKKYGFAGSLICNADYTLINGNSRWKRALALKHKQIKVDVPSRKLTPSEFKEFSALFDFARAGEVDLLAIKKDLGTTASWFKQWGLDMPKQAIDNLRDLEKAQIDPRKGNDKQIKTEAYTSRPITLTFTAAENEEFIKIAEGQYAKYKVDNVTDLTIKVFRQIKKLR